MGTPMTGSEVWAARTPARWARVARAGDDDPDAPVAGLRGDFGGPGRAPVGRGHGHFVGYAEFLQDARRALHDAQIRIAAHEDRHPGRLLQPSQGLFPDVPAMVDVLPGNLPRRFVGPGDGRFHPVSQGRHAQYAAAVGEDFPAFGRVPAWKTIRSSICAAASSPEMGCPFS
jgi:hypothetical protein